MNILLAEKSANTMPENDVSQIYLKLLHLTQLLEERAKAMDERQERQDARMAKMELRLDGPEAFPERGVIVRLDRVEQWKGRAQKALWALYGSGSTYFLIKLLAMIS